MSVSLIFSYDMPIYSLTSQTPVTTTPTNVTYKVANYTNAGGNTDYMFTVPIPAPLKTLALTLKDRRESLAHRFQRVSFNADELLQGKGGWSIAQVDIWVRHTINNITLGDGAGYNFYIHYATCGNKLRFSIQDSYSSAFNTYGGVEDIVIEFEQVNLERVV